MNCVHVEASSLGVPRGVNDRAERIDDDDRRGNGLDLLGDARHDLHETTRQDFLGQIDELNRVLHLGDVEERELLLISQHLERRFADQREEQRPSALASLREHDLVRERRLSRAGTAGDQIERELWQAAPEHLVEAGHARGQAPYGDSLRHVECSFPGLSNTMSGHASHNRRIVNLVPTKVVRSSPKEARTATAASAAPALDCRSSDRRRCAGGGSSGSDRDVRSSHENSCDAR